MFGLWRLSLALEVVLFHLLGVPLIGAFAVTSFFVLSGFLMTAIMDRTYGYSWAGRRAFALNRAVRLLPPYWYACAVTLALIVLLGPDYMASVKPHMQLPASTSEWLQNLSALFLGDAPIAARPRLVPPSWALTVELIFYAAIALGLSRSRRIALVWLGLSALYVMFCLTADGGLRSLYGSVAGGSFPFALGAVTYRYRHALRAVVEGVWQHAAALYVLRFAVALLAIGLVAAGESDWRLRELFNHINAVISALLVLCLFRQSWGGRVEILDQRAGALSYPIYLLHWQAAALAGYVVFGHAALGLSREGLVSFLIAMPILLALCIVVTSGLDPVLRGWRNATRSRAADRMGHSMLSRPAVSGLGG